MDNEEPLLVVDTRIEFMFNQGHLPKSIDIPVTSGTEEMTTALLALPKDKKIIFYCDWPDDAESAFMADKLLKLDAGFGTDKIFVLWKGYFRWQELGYPLEK